MADPRFAGSSIPLHTSCIIVPVLCAPSHPADMDSISILVIPQARRSRAAQPRGQGPDPAAIVRSMRRRLQSRIKVSERFVSFTMRRRLRATWCVPTSSAELNSDSIIVSPHHHASTYRLAAPAVTSCERTTHSRALTPRLVGRRSSR